MVQSYVGQQVPIRLFTLKWIPARLNGYAGRFSINQIGMPDYDFLGRRCHHWKRTYQASITKDLPPCMNYSMELQTGRTGEMPDSSLDRCSVGGTLTF